MLKQRDNSGVSPDFYVLLYIDFSQCILYPVARNVSNENRRCYCAATFGSFVRMENA